MSDLKKNNTPEYAAKAATANKDDAKEILRLSAEFRKYWKIEDFFM